MADREGPRGAAGSRERGSTPSGATAQGHTERTGPMDEATSTAKAMGEDLRSTTREKGRELKQEAERRLDEAASRTGDRATSVAKALRSAGEELRSEGEERLASLADDAADQVRKFATYLEDETPERMLHDVERIARSNPTLFLGGTFAVGLLAGRFLGSGERRGERREEMQRRTDTAGGPSGAGMPRSPGERDTGAARRSWAGTRRASAGGGTGGFGAGGAQQPGSTEPRSGHGSPTTRPWGEEAEEDES